jgi:hypothetical protein
MSDNVLIVLIVAVALVCVIAVFALRGRLRSGSIKVSKDGIQGGVQTHEQPKTSVSGNKIKGDGHHLQASNGGQINQNEIDGSRVKIDSANS